MAAQHHDDGLVLLRGADDRVHDTLEVAGDEDVGEGVEEGAERAVIARRA